LKGGIPINEGIRGREREEREKIILSKIAPGTESKPQVRLREKKSGWKRKKGRKRGFGGHHLPEPPSPRRKSKGEVKRKKERIEAKHQGKKTNR